MAKILVLAKSGFGKTTSYCGRKKLDIKGLNPKETFVFGNDYRIPMMHGLLSKNFVDKLKMSPSFNIESFQREYRLLYSINIVNCWEILRAKYTTA